MTAATIPIVLIGSHRSGTTMLGDCMAKHPDVTYWLEPNHIWTWGRYAKMKHDRLDASNADEKTKAYIRGRFLHRQTTHGKSRVCEKTPANALRIPFIQAIFPDVKIVHILRDPRGVVSSNIEKMEGGGYGWQAVVRRMGRTPLWEWPQHFDKMKSEILLKLFGKRLPIFGPKPPGWEQWMQLSPLEITALQWREMTKTACADGRTMSPDAYTEVRYEAFVENPAGEIEKIWKFCKLARSESALQAVRTEVRADSAARWKSLLSDEEQSTLRRIVETQMKEIGYSWDAAS